MFVKKVERYYGNERAAKAIYGAILLFAYLISTSHKDEISAISIAVGTVLAAIAIVTAEVYAEIIGKTVSHKKKLSKTERKEIRNDAYAIISVSMWPTLIFLISWLGVYSVSFAFQLSYAFLLFVVYIFSYWSFLVRGASNSRSIILAASVTLIGLFVIIIKYILGH